MVLVLRLGVVNLPLKPFLLAFAVIALATMGSGSAAVAAPKQIAGLIGGQFGSTGDAFVQPRGIAVNATGAGAADPGDMYVVDTNNRRIVVLDADGTFKFAFGRDVIAEGAGGDLGDTFETCTVATDCQQGSTGTVPDGPGGEFSTPQGIAVDQATGDVFVRERNDNRRIQRFTAAGGFVAAWGWDVIAPGGADDLGDVFEVCTVAAACQAAADTGGGGQAGQFGASATNSTGIAVSPVTGNVFAVDPGNRRVMEFDPDAGAPGDVFVRAFGWAVDGGTTFETCTTASGCMPATTGTANGQFANSNPLRIAVGLDDVVYASDGGSAGTANRIVRFDADLAPASGDATGALLDPIYPTSGTPTAGPLLDGVTQDLAIVAGSGNLLVTRDPAAGNTVVEELSNPSAPAPTMVADSPHVFAEATTNGLTFNPVTGYVYVSSATSASGQGLYVLAESPGTPTDVEVDQPLAVGADSVTLSGRVNPQRGTVSYRFEVSDTGDVDDWDPVDIRRYASGAGVVEVVAEARGLEPNTTYRVRLSVAKQTTLDAASTTTSGEAVFLTDSLPPAVATLGSTDRTDRSATLRATIDPNGSDTTYWFEYGGQGGSLDSRVPIPNANAGTGNTPQLVVQPVTGLVPSTAYTYRIVAQSAAGTSTGDTVNFTTEASGGGPLPPPARGYELVSPADKIAGVGIGTWGAEPSSMGSAGVAAYDGERFAAQGSQGAMLLDSAQAYANDWAFADRVDDTRGWVSHTPHTHPSHDAADTRFASPHAATGDLSRLSWRSNNSTLTVFPELENWPDGLKPSVLSDWQGRWEMFGPTDLAQLTEPRSTSGDEVLCDIAFSRDGTATLCNTDLASDAGGIATIRGLGGIGDPTHPSWPDLVAGRSVYLADTSAPLADSFPGTGVRTLVNVCADDTQLPALDGDGEIVEAPCPAPSGPDSTLVSDHGATIAIDDPSAGGGAGETVRNVVSGNGSRVFFMAPDPSAPGVPDGVSSFCTAGGEVCPSQLFVRQRNSDGSVTTRWISRAEDGLFGSQDASLLGTVRFEAASVDGDKVFFRTNSPLTSDDPNGTGSAPVTTGSASEQSWDLYMYDFPDNPAVDPAEGELTRISGGPGGQSDCNSPVGGSGAVGALRFASDDGSRVYFTCAAPLEGAPDPPGSGTVTSPGGIPTTTDQSNLYLHDTGQTDSERWRFVARLPRATGAASATCATTGLSPGSALDGGGFYGGGSNCVRGSFDGAFVTLWTLGQLTSDDPAAQATADIYGYDADRNDLVRITAPAGGSGGAYPCGVVAEAATTSCNGDGGYDHIEFKQRVSNPLLGVATAPLVAGSRIAYFQSRSQLVATDTDSAMDVYEWRDGTLSMLTGGVSSGVDAFYKGNDRSGRNVYFATTDSVTWQDHDVVADVYTARIGGGIVQSPAPPLCDVLAGGCRQPGRAADVAAPGSVSPGTRGVAPGGDGATRSLRVVKLNARARRRAARSGVLLLKVRVPGPGVVRANARARVPNRRGKLVMRRVGSGKVRAADAGRVTVRLRLRRPAVAVLARGRSLSIAIRISSPGADAESVRLVLRRAGR